ncbi:hypothetical protein GCM10027566_27120 [Arachidicoccus ginsenosidivorans]
MLPIRDEFDNACINNKSLIYGPSEVDRSNLAFALFDIVKTTHNTLNISYDLLNADFYYLMTKQNISPLSKKGQKTILNLNIP